MNGLSFVIPYYNSISTINICINSIKSQNFNFPIEIIIVDNNSDISVRKIIQSDCQVINEASQGRSFARNTGAKCAQYDYICFIDSDVELEDTWLERTVDYVKKTQFDGYECFISNTSLNEDSFLDEYRSIFRGGNYNLEDSSIRKFPIINSACCIYKKTSFLEIGGFDEQLNWCEDADLSKRLFLGGGNLAVIPDSKCRCYYDGTIFTYIKRKFYAGLLGYKYLIKWETQLNSLPKVMSLLIKDLITPPSSINKSKIKRKFTHLLFYRLLLVINLLGHLYARFKYTKYRPTKLRIKKVYHHNSYIKNNYAIVLGRNSVVIKENNSQKMYKINTKSLHLFLSPPFIQKVKNNKKYFFLKGNSFN